MTTKPASIAAEPLPLAQQLVPLELIDVPANRLRQPDPDWVHVLGKSMAERGQLQPVRIAEAAGGRYELIFGHARLLAAAEIGWDRIDAVIVPADHPAAQHRRLDELFENIVRHDLNALNRAVALGEVKAIHETLYPDAKRGGDHKKKQQLKSQNEIFSFSQSAAERTGLSQRAIQIAVSIVEGLAADSLARLRGTGLASNQSQLVALAAITQAQQAAVLDILIAAKPKAANVADALVLAQGGKLATPAERAFRSLNDGLTRVGPKHRAAIYDRFEGEIKGHARARGWFK
ncbi:MAG TPA: ParB N-terminal domain-containing protein [Devosia sp.]|jgi:ParB family chromosome partitioning protein|nr:ParB N-terminal domain-containing protein [Devosia sp.]